MSLFRSFAASTLALLVVGLAPEYSAPAFAQRIHFEEARELQRNAAEAYASGDVATFIALLRDALALRPNHPTLLYNLAAGYARIDRPDSALRYLDRLAALGLSFDLKSDSDFETIRSLPAFEAVAASLAPGVHATSRSDTAFVLPQAAQIPEAVVYDLEEDAFYVSSVYDRAIYRRRGTIIDKLIDLDALPFDDCFCHGGVPPGTPRAAESGAGSSFVGLAIDTARGILWATLSTVDGLVEVLAENALQADTIASPALVQVGRTSGTLLASFTLPGEGRRFLGDLAVGPDGTVYVAETHEGAIYALHPGQQQLAPLVRPGSLVSPQGIAVAPDGRSIIVADYALGIMRIDLPQDAQRSGVYEVKPPQDAMLMGIDGLLWYGQSLIAIQNGSRPQRILHLPLNTAATAITRVEVLEADHPAFPEPTTGLVHEDTLFYVGNSNWNLLEASETRSESTPPPRLILKLPLSGQK